MMTRSYVSNCVLIPRYISDFVLIPRYVSNFALIPEQDHRGCKRVIRWPAVGGRPTPEIVNT
jgi:hypothetical protein